MARGRLPKISAASFISPSVLATVDGTRPGSDSEASSTIHPRFKVGEEVTGTGLVASEVLPMPPGLVKVTTGIGRVRVSQTAQAAARTDHPRFFISRVKIVRRRPPDMRVRGE